jgi:hypothetical protein
MMIPMISMPIPMTSKMKIMMNNTTTTKKMKPRTNLNNTNKLRINSNKLTGLEIKDIIQDARININMQEQNNNANEQQLEQPAEHQEAPEESTRRLTPETRPIERLEPQMSGKSYVKQQKKVIFESDADLQLGYCHNLITQDEPDEDQSKEYSPSNTMLMARLIYDLNTRIVREGASFAQQYLLNKGLKIFGQKRGEASKKEMDQLHQRSCFIPMSIAKMTQIEWRKAQQALMFLGEK